MSFSIDLTKFATKFGIQADVAARKIIFDIQRDVMLETPVLEGFLRSNWFVGLGSPSGEARLDLADGKTDSAVRGRGTSAQAQAVGTMAAFKWGQTVYLTNNLPYANFIEFGGSTVKAPDGMLRVTVARYQASMGRWS